MHRDPCGRTPLDNLIYAQIRLLEARKRVTVSQSQFDQDLAAEAAATNAYIAAVNAFVAAAPVVNLAAEDASVNTLLADIKAAEAAIPAPAPAPAPATPPAA